MAAIGTCRRIHGEGEVAEVEWRDWLGTLQPPDLSISDLLDARQRLVVISPHPDDEILTSGGLIALHAQRGGTVAIVAVTDGEASHRGDLSWTAERLAEARRLERQRGLLRLGVGADAVSRLCLLDSQVAADAARLEQALLSLLQPTDCVVSTWRLDGHPDHDATGTTAARVCGNLGCRLLEAPVWMWHWSEPNDPRVPWHRLRTLELPRETLEGKVAALAEHTTQLSARALEPPVLGAAILARAARRSEYFLV